MALGLTPPPYQKSEPRENQMRAAPPLRCDGHQGVRVSPYEKAETATRCGFPAASSRGRWPRVGENPRGVAAASKGKAPGAKPGDRRFRGLGLVPDAQLWRDVSSLRLPHDSWE